MSERVSLTRDLTTGGEVRRVWCDSPPRGSSIGNCAQPAVVKITRDFSSVYDTPRIPSVWVSNHCADHAAVLRDGSDYVSEVEITQ